MALQNTADRAFANGVLTKPQAVSQFYREDLARKAQIGLAGSALILLRGSLMFCSGKAWPATGYGMVSLLLRSQFAHRARFQRLRGS